MLSGISMPQILIVLAIVVIIFGTKKLRGMGSDLGGAVKGFKEAMNDNDAPKNIENDSKTSGEHDAQFAEQASQDSNSEKERDRTNV